MQFIPVKNQNHYSFRIMFQGAESILYAVLESSKTKHGFITNCWSCDSTKVKILSEDGQKLSKVGWVTVVICLTSENLNVLT